MVDPINTLPWEGLAYKITDRPCQHFKDGRHIGDCSTCSRSVLEEVAAKARKEERERCAKLVDEWAKAYPTSMFGFVADGKHGPTVDSCSAKALRLTLPRVAEAIRGDDLDESSES